MEPRMEEPRIAERAPTMLVGVCHRAGEAHGGTVALWRRFMPRRAEIAGRVGEDLVSMRVFHQDGEPLTSQTPFDEWAAVEVAAEDGSEPAAPEGMEAFALPGGVYAVFLHRGLPSALPRMLERVFGLWLPRSDYRLDDRPHLAVMGPGYRPDDPDAVEEIWVPVAGP